MTLATKLVLRALLENPTKARYGNELCEAAELPSGTIHPILARFEGIGWLESYWEDIDPHEEGRPRRRYYQLSPDGAEHARLALAHSHKTKNLRSPGLRPDLAGGGV